MRGWTLLLALAACGDNLDVDASANLARDIISTDLTIDVTAQHGTAVITLGPNATAGATLEVGDLAIESVTSDGKDIAAAQHDGQLDLGIVSYTKPVEVTIDYTYTLHDRADGVSKNGYTLVWPYYCSNIFPCHSSPGDGSAFSLELTGVPEGKTAVYPESMPDAPAYQLAWQINDLTEISLGTTTNGTEILGWYLPNREAKFRTGAAKLRDAFDWLEQTYGPYQFGPRAGTVNVAWSFTGLAPNYVLGGMEHHPFWHISGNNIEDPSSHIHEAAHGWYGDGIRIACWEDMVLSEGTITYITGRVLDVLYPGNPYFTNLYNGLHKLPDAERVWPQSCGVVDGVKMINNDVYDRGGMFYRSLALKIGTEQVDDVLHKFYMKHMLGAARFSDMLDEIKADTGYDAAACADTWLESIEIPPAGPCP